MHDKKRDILESLDKGVDQAKHPLASLLRIVLRDLRINPYRWAQLMDNYLSDPRNGIPQTPKDRSSERGNLNKELRKPKITFNTLMKGLRLLNPVSVRLELHLRWHTDRVTVHGLDVLMRTRREAPDGQVVSALYDHFDHMLGTDRSPDDPPPSAEHDS